MRWRLDSTWARVGEQRRVVLGGSPLTLFRLSERGAAVADALESGAAAPSSLSDRLVRAGAIHPIPDLPSAHGPVDVTIVTPQLGGVVADDGRVTVDDASQPPLTGAALRLERNVGPAGARNAGRACVSTELVAFVDADVGLPVAVGAPSAAEWWGPLLAHFDDPRVGLVAPRVVGDDGSSLDLGREPGRVRAGTRVSYVPGAMMIVRVSAFDDVGGFDERLRSGEDVDLVWRLDQADWVCRYDPRRSVHHRPRSSWTGRIRQQVNYGASSGPLALRHPDALAPFRSSGWVLATWMTIAVGRPLLGGVLAVGSAGALARKLPDVPPAASARLAMSGHVAAGRQLSTAVRRAWWPIVLAASLLSRRARRVALAAVLADPRRLHIDVAFGWGLWRSMRRHRTWRPIAPQITAWP